MTDLISPSDAAGNEAARGQDVNGEPRGSLSQLLTRNPCRADLVEQPPGLARMRIERSSTAGEARNFHL